MVCGTHFIWCKSCIIKSIRYIRSFIHTSHIMTYTYTLDLWTNRHNAFCKLHTLGIYQHIYSVGIDKLCAADTMLLLRQIRLTSYMSLFTFAVRYCYCHRKRSFVRYDIVSYAYSNIVYKMSCCKELWADGNFGSLIILTRGAWEKKMHSVLNIVHVTYTKHIIICVCVCARTAHNTIYKAFSINQKCGKES